MDEFLAWLEENKEHFKNYLDAEISAAARARGFSDSVIRQWQIHQRFQKGA